VIGATGIAALVSVVFGAMAFSVEWLFGATVPVPFDTVFGAMVGTHSLIGVGEGLISALVVGAVLAARPDLVHGARDLSLVQLADRKPVKVRVVLISGVLVALFLGAVVSQFAAGGPDGLEKVATDTGIIESQQDHPLGSSWFAEYATDGVGNESLSLALAGIAGTLITLGVGLGVFYAVRDRGTRPDHEAVRS